MLKKINLNEIFLCSTYKISEITFFDKIKEYRESYIVDNKYSMKYLLYPGFLFSSNEDANLYYKNFYNKMENLQTPPRGNLHKKSNYAFIGIKPGFGAKDSGYESCWLLGETSTKTLHNLLLNIKIYPYFTNVYKTYNDEQNKNIDLILEELTLIKEICKDIIFIFMGNYEEYNIIIDKLNLKDYKKIWHPAYLVRNGNSSLLFNNWKNQLGNINKNMRIFYVS